MKKICTLLILLSTTSYADTDKQSREESYNQAPKEAPFCACVFDKNRVWVPGCMKDPETGVFYECSQWEEDRIHCKETSKMSLERLKDPKACLSYSCSHKDNGGWKCEKNF